MPIVIGTVTKGAVFDSVVNAVDVGSFTTLSEKITPISGDLLLLADSADSYNRKKVQIGNLPTGSSYTDEQAQDAIGAMINSTLVYTDATPLLERAAITGDVSVPLTSNTSTLATVNSNVGSFGSATQVATFTVNAKGLITAASNTSISIASTAVSDFTEAAQDAIGAMVNTTLTYTDATPSLVRSAITGDVSIPSTSNAATLATVNSNVGSFGSATQVATFTVNAKGLITAASNTSIAIASTAVSDFNEAAQDAVGAMVNSTLVYTDATPLLERAAITGDVSVPLTSNTATLATVNSNVGSFGSATQVATFTVNAKGLITAAGATNISIASTAVSDFTEASQDAVGAMVNSTLVYTDATPLLERAAITGDVSVPLTSNTATLATVNSNVGSFGSATQVGTFTVNAKGLVTAASNTSIAIASTAVSDFTEAAQDAIGAMVNSTLVYTDATPSLVRAAITGDVSVPSTSNTATIANNAVTYAKMQAASAVSKLIGSSDSSTTLQEITLGTNLSMSGTTLNATGGGSTPTGTGYRRVVSGVEDAAASTTIGEDWTVSTDKKIKFRDANAYLQSTVSGYLTVVGMNGTTIGTAGDVVVGEASSTCTFYPNTGATVNLGYSSGKMNDGYFNGVLTGWRTCLEFGRSASVVHSSAANDDYLYGGGGAQGAATVGFTTIRAGSITGISARLYCTAQTGGGTLRFTVKASDLSKLYTDVVITANPSSPGSYSTASRGTYDVSAGENITVKLTWQTGNVTVEKIHVLVELTFDT